MVMAARTGDGHICPLVVDGVAHMGGRITSGSSDVHIECLPAARSGDLAACVGIPDILFGGSNNTLINGRSAVRTMDSTAHGGLVIQGACGVIVGSNGEASALIAAARRGAALVDLNT